MKIVGSSELYLLSTTSVKIFSFQSEKPPLPISSKIIKSSSIKYFKIFPEVLVHEFCKASCNLISLQYRDVLKVFKIHSVMAAQV